MIEPYDRYDALTRKLESDLNQKPVCDCCGEHIQTEYYYSINDFIFCEFCVTSGKKSNY